MSNRNRKTLGFFPAPPTPEEMEAEERNERARLRVEEQWRLDAKDVTRGEFEDFQRRVANALAGAGISLENL